MLPLEFTDSGDYDGIHQGDRLVIENARDALAGGAQITMRNARTGQACQARHRLSPRQIKIVLAGGLIPMLAH